MSGNVVAQESITIVQANPTISFLRTMETIQIQDVQPEDTAMLDALMRRVVTTSVKLENAERAEVFENIHKNLYWAQENVSSVVHLKCTDGNRIVGVILIKNFWNLCSLFVDRESQRQGIGRALLTTAIQRCVFHSDKGYVKVNSAANAVTFYQALGFSVIDDAPRRGTSVPMVLRWPVSERKDSFSDCDGLC